MTERYADREFPGTYLFDGAMAKKGYALNKMCYSFNEQQARDEFNADPEAYCNKYRLTDTQKKAIFDKDIIGLLREGGSIYYLAKYAGLLKLNMQDIGALQTGMSVDEFKDMLVKNARGEV
ncbi:protocatechuate 4,5-dioxygenase subunit alpha [Maribrevibacterium harenarium]|uniref:Protocatechuate 4,5-dioxygenase subunit alpha n=1 Tax=Maribrevibacterium harenarium TaxID=2589817 RepID=A0A501WFB8_9GAMM|nr:protocatechuate 4,5-dioxygenase subunit alpha [Maribrevibacterium harenarium]TPE47502.1 protocatechuate 4,5-dioxygenase subunit alpha [Maribrevibacterium harenarium]